MRIVLSPLELGMTGFIYGYLPPSSVPDLYSIHRNLLIAPGMQAKDRLRERLYAVSEAKRPDGISVTCITMSARESLIFDKRICSEEFGYAEIHPISP
jgi:hypothetical protein